MNSPAPGLLFGGEVTGSATTAGEQRSLIVDPLVVDVFVSGVPQVQGNLRISPPKKAGRKPRLYYQNSAALSKWKKAVARTVRQSTGPGCFKGPLYIRIRFFLPMPAYKRQAYERGRLPHLWKTERQDLDKLVRAVFDAIADTGRIDDDSQFVRLVTEKRFAATPGSEGAHIMVGPAENG